MEFGILKFELERFALQLGVYVLGKDIERQSTPVRGEFKNSLTQLVISAVVKEELETRKVNGVFTV